MANKGMLNKVRLHAEKIAENRRAKKQLREIKRQEEKLRVIQEEKRQVLAQKKRIQQEKEHLLSLSREELAVELILAVRGFYEEFSELKKAQDILAKKIDEMESDLESGNYDNDNDEEIEQLRSELEQLKNEINNTF